MTKTCDASFAVKASAGRFVVERAGSEHLDGDIAPEPCIIGTIDDAHPAGTDFLLDAITADSRACFDQRDLLRWSGDRSERAEERQGRNS
jgi:hypothetical protein